MLKIGHRGAAGHVMENSLASIRHALGLEVDMVEFDVRTTHDGEVVVFHDALLDRVTNSKGWLKDWSLAELNQQVRLNQVDEPIPTLEAVCELLKHESVLLYLEIKETCMEDRVLAIALKHLPPQRIYIAAFNHNVIFNTKQSHPEIKTIANMEAQPVNLPAIWEASDCDCLGLGLSTVNQELVHQAQQAGRKVFVWTVNHPAEIAAVRSLGVDGMVSNYPDRL